MLILRRNCLKFTPTVNIGIDKINDYIPYIDFTTILIIIPFIQLNEYSLNFRILIGNRFFNIFYISVGMQMYINRISEIIYTTNVIIILLIFE